MSMDSARETTSREDIEQTNRLWRERYPMILGECAHSGNHSAEKFTAPQTAFNLSAVEFRQLKKTRAAWKAFLQKEADPLAKALPDSRRFDEAQEAWIREINCRECPLNGVQNDWEWLASVLSSPERFAELGLAKYRNQHIAIYRQQIWCGANTRPEAVRVATEIIQKQNGETVNQDDIVVYFL